MGKLKVGEPGNFSLHTSGVNVLAEQLVFAKIYLQDDYLLGHHYQVTLGGLLPLLFCQCVQHVCREGGGASLLWQVQHLLL